MAGSLHDAVQIPLNNLVEGRPSRGKERHSPPCYPGEHAPGPARGKETPTGSRDPVQQRQARAKQPCRPPTHRTSCKKASISPISSSDRFG